MPKKVRAFDDGRKRRLSAMKSILPPDLDRARKYRSSANWQKVRAIFMQKFPLCCDPFGTHEKDDRPVPGQQVHHVKEVATHFQLRCYAPNLRTICTKCHAAVSVLERQYKPTEYLFNK